MWRAPPGVLRRQFMSTFERQFLRPYIARMSMRQAWTRALLRVRSCIAFRQLEHELHRPLDDARGDAASASRVEGRGQLPEGSRVRRQTRGSEVRVVENVEPFQCDAETQALEKLVSLESEKS